MRVGFLLVWTRLCDEAFFFFFTGISGGGILQQGTSVNLGVLAERENTVSSESQVDLVIVSSYSNESTYRWLQQQASLSFRW